MTFLADQGHFFYGHVKKCILRNSFGFSKVDYTSGKKQYLVDFYRSLLDKKNKAFFFWGVSLGDFLVPKPLMLPEGPSPLYKKGYVIYSP